MQAIKSLRDMTKVLISKSNIPFLTICLSIGKQFLTIPKETGKRFKTGVFKGVFAIANQTQGSLESKI